jgi:hypothetical protein
MPSGEKYRSFVITGLAFANAEHSNELRVCVSLHAWDIGNRDSKICISFDTNRQQSAVLINLVRLGAYFLHYRV